MERRFELRVEELLKDAELDPRIPDGMLDRLEQFVKPFAAIMESPAQEQHLWEYVAGLFSGVKRKNAETIAYFHDQNRQALQKFIGQWLWDDGLLIEELSRQVGTELGESDGVIVFDPSGFRKQGKDSVGVARQWCGRYGKIDNCQVGIYLGYVSRKEHALVDVRLYLNKDWAKDKKRRKKCGVPEEIRFRTRHALALEMLAEHGTRLPHAWIAGDDEMGRSSAFRRDLRALGEQYLLAVPSNTLMRDLEAEAPEYSGRGPSSAGSFRARGSLARGIAQGCLDNDRRAGWRQRSAGGASGEGPSPGEGRPASQRSGGDVADSAGRAERWNDEARLLSFECLAGNDSAGVCPRGQGRASDRGVPGARQERCGSGPVPGSQLGWMASSSNTFVVGDLVPDAGRPAGKKNTHRLSRSRRSARSLQRCYAARSTAALPATSNARATAFQSATNLPMRTIGNRITSCPR